MCTKIRDTSSFLVDGEGATTVNVRFFSKTYTTPSSTTRAPSDELYFQDVYNLNINDITATPMNIDDYCPGQHPFNRPQRYFFCPLPDTSRCPNQYQTYPGCPVRDGLNYSNIPANFFNARTSTTDDANNFLEVSDATLTTSSFC
jgi:hypothetical protein